jgi:D-glycero-alpha-D-manno-heptose-7-phosphate kinase
MSKLSVVMKAKLFKQDTVRRLLSNRTVHSQAPCRIDCGGTWDLRAFALSCYWAEPLTINIALDKYVTVRLSEGQPGMVAVNSAGFARAEERLSDLPFDGTLGLVFVIAYYFQLDGISLEIQSEFRPQSGLGGSGAVAVAVIAAIARLLVEAGMPRLNRNQMAILGYNLEDSLTLSPTGLQDQAAAAFGGANRWLWRYTNSRQPFVRQPLWPADEYDQLSRHILVAFSGQTHVSAELNDAWIRSFVSGKSRSQWLAILSAARAFGDALEKKDWAAATNALQTETALRVELTPQVLTPAMQELVRHAEQERCAARFCGAGGGGHVWAIGKETDIERLRSRWEKSLKTFDPPGELLSVSVTRFGVRTRILDRFR